jgi:hypothetical protein
MLGEFVERFIKLLQLAAKLFGVILGRAFRHPETNDLAAPFHEFVGI